MGIFTAELQELSFCKHNLCGRRCSAASEKPSIDFAAIPSSQILVGADKERMWHVHEGARCPEDFVYPLLLSFRYHPVGRGRRLHTHPLHTVGKSLN